MEAVAQRLAQIPGVVVVTLGGSRAEGTAGDDSDWDFGLYYVEPIDPADVAALGWPGRVFATWSVWPVWPAVCSRCRGSGETRRDRSILTAPPGDRRSVGDETGETVAVGGGQLVSGIYGCSQQRHPATGRGNRPQQRHPLGQVDDGIARAGHAAVLGADVERRQALLGRHTRKQLGNPRVG